MGPTLQDRGFGRADIVKIAGNSGGVQALKAVFEHGPALMQAGRSNKDIMDIAARKGAASQIRKMAAQLSGRQ
ncbi:TAL effector repeat-containing protein [Mycetohabitans sp. B5]|uniref:TAL effector repeat-containing protein n=1 Tax=Mycetohabitans sp. B5 TaxID=2841846 RepID=UPI001304D71D|nr:MULTISPECIES: TAL effector repeat-containing protein [Mycetohabitans]MCG1056021.1 TAL effector repeat-containing protein [Mycetohabitans sp. B5]